jgi:mono/diheme cytochrome c family protein
MKRTVLTIAGTLCASAIILTLGGVGFVYSGVYDVSATAPDSGLMYWTAHQTMEHSVKRRMGANIAPANLHMTATIAAGGALYADNCVICHGAPDRERSDISMGLNPQPPDLFDAMREPDAAEDFQFIKYGVKMTGMPGFAGTKTDDHIWALVGFLNTAPGLGAADFARISRPPPAFLQPDIENSED